MPVTNYVVRQGQQLLQVRSVLFRVKDDWYASAVVSFRIKRTGKFGSKGTGLHQGRIAGWWMG